MRTTVALLPASRVTCPVSSGATHEVCPAGTTARSKVPDEASVSAGVIWPKTSALGTPPSVVGAASIPPPPSAAASARPASAEAPPSLPPSSGAGAPSGPASPPFPPSTPASPGAAASTTGFTPPLSTGPTKLAAPDARQQ